MAGRSSAVIASLALFPFVVSAIGPCDIYGGAGTPCVAAHSLTRALYGNFNGNLYQVKRLSDNATLDIGVTAPGGVANSASQDAFCRRTSCVVQRVYDQVRRYGVYVKRVGTDIGERSHQ
jgi:hypothetical protein